MDGIKGAVAEMGREGGEGVCGGGHGWGHSARCDAMLRVLEVRGRRRRRRYGWGRRRRRASEWLGGKDDDDDGGGVECYGKILCTVMWIRSIQPNPKSGQ